ncbi:SET domain-containing protein-lysine N-methyltransferase [Desulforhopalus vacuolatus]|uniref:SET domain-containing protein-lysine N-methyltransferase n=1 Tax=Desulforhopalus vacuolatus TaxID=40414 RepID=UPI001963589F|nr:SET domain-containing protein-lysine N-methyltransferase [Desulforhopalus vacuolatus]MBM9520231.1 SET domain-containing protein-lysine N-methyltransferase [Desulforhopalus vacuolatus]
MLIYPHDFGLDPNFDYPKKEDFTVCRREDGKGAGVYTKKDLKRGEMITRITGNIVPTVMQHTLQITPTTHMYDPYFTGYILHSCAPNIYLDMTEFELWALRDIDAGQALTMDYAQTEDILFKQFPCLCGTPNCRFWITGRKEEVSPEGIAYIEQQLEQHDRESSEIVMVAC